MNKFRAIYFDDNEERRSKIFKALDVDDAIGKAMRWLRYNTSFQLGTLHDVVRVYTQGELDECDHNECDTVCERKRK